MKKVLYISLKSRISEMKHFANEFILNGYEFEFFDLESIQGYEDLLLKKITEYQPDRIIIHHNRQLYSPSTWEKIARMVHVTWWMNDERYPIPVWMYDLANKVNLWLVASYDTRDSLRHLGGKAEYLIMGFNKKDKPKVDRNINLVFTGQNSGNMFPLSRFRYDLITGLQHRINKGFEVYGKGWAGCKAVQVGSGIYAHAKMGISVGHFNTSATYSNRVLQIMGNGALCLMHRKDGLDKFFEGKVVFYDGVKDCYQKYKYYLINERERLEIAEKGRKFVNDNLTWECKAKDIMNLWR